MNSSVIKWTLFFFGFVFSRLSFAGNYVFDPYIPGNQFLGLSHISANPQLDHQTLDDGVATLLRLNVKSAFFYLTADYQSKYVHQDFGLIKPHSLVHLAQLSPYRRAFSQFENIVLTCTSDSFSLRGLSIRDHFLTNEEFEANKNEFYNLTLYLMKTYKGSKKRFILKNWEGDWFLLGNQGNSNLSVSDRTVNNFVRWFQSTQQGIAMARNQLAGSSDVKVDFALEMNQIGIVQACKKNTFLGAVVPRVPSDWISYSSWETISNHGGPQDSNAIYSRIRKDIADIRRISGRPVIISEFGYSENGEPSEQIRKIQAALRGFKDAGVRMAFYWNTYEDTYGIFRTDGHRTENGAFIALKRESMIEQAQGSIFYRDNRTENVTSAYWEIFGRSPDVGGLNYWVRHEASKDAQKIRSFFIQTKEAQIQINNLYLRYVGYKPDSGSIQYISGLLTNGKSIYDISALLFRDHLFYNTPPIKVVL